MKLIDGNCEQYTPISVGPDWLTATEKNTGPRLQFREIAQRVFDEERAAGVEMKPAALYGFEGLRGRGFFFGLRDHDGLIVLSGPRTPALAAEVTRVASNVSRIDLQVTLDTSHDKPNLALHGWQTLARSPTRRGRKGSCTLITTRPKGDTLNDNSRRSDQCGRIYDKATEAKLGEAKTLWRYEVEFKRHRANNYAAAYSSSADPETMVSQLVGEWFFQKGLVPFWNFRTLERSALMSLDRPDRHILEWFENVVSLSVARSINAYGIRVTLEALGLNHLLYEREEEDSTNAAAANRSLPSDVDR